MEPPKGLPNFGNTCFLNASLQAVGSTSAAQNLLSKIESISLNNAKLVSVFLKFMKYVQFGEEFNVKELWHSATSGMLEYTRGMQMDADQCITHILDRLHTELAIQSNPRSPKLSQSGVLNMWEMCPTISPVRDEFFVMLSGELSCCACRRRYRAYDPPDTCLRIPVPDTHSTTLDHCMNMYISADEDNTERKCSFCGAAGEVTERLCFHRLPPVLIIQLKRFKYTNNNASKLATKISFPMVLKIKQDNRVERQYALKAAIFHIGPVLYSGHYVAACLRGNQWYYFDDNKVTPIESPSLVTGDVYSLIYEHAPAPAPAPDPDLVLMSDISTIYQKTPTPDLFCENPDAKHTDDDSSWSDVESGGEADDDYEWQPGGSDDDEAQKYTSNVTIRPKEKQMVSILKAPTVKLEAASPVKSVAFKETANRSIPAVKPSMKSVVRLKKKDSYFPTLQECFNQYDDLPSQAKKHCCEELPLEELDVCLSEGDVPGAALNLDQLELYTVEKLKRWLVCRRLLTEGRKADLCARIKQHANLGKAHLIDPGVDDGIWHAAKLRELRQRLHKDISSDKRWPIPPITNWGKFPSSDIPQYFNKGQVVHYLVERAPTWNSDEDFPDNLINKRQLIGITNPFKRAEQYLQSQSLLKLEDNIFKGHYFLKAQIQASYESKKHIVHITISASSGTICDAVCDCIMKSLGRCCHVSAVLLHVCQHIDGKGYEAATTTTQRQYWGKGGTRRNPGVLSERQYFKKFDVATRAQFDPRPTRNQENCMSKDQIQRFLEDLKKVNPNKKIMFVTLLDSNVESQDENFDHEDIKIKCVEFLDELAYKFPDPEPQEIMGTSEQGNSDLWKEERRFRVVASQGRRIIGLLSHRSTWNGKINFLKEHVWGMDAKLKQLPAFIYGSTNEPTAKICYQKKVSESGLLVVSTGMWVNGKHPQLSCSPDGLVGHVVGNCNFQVVKVLEVKCPISMEKINPKDFDTNLTRKQLSSHFLKRECDGSISLKCTSDYYFQVQMNMAILEVHQCDFVIWSPVDILIIPISFNEKYWSEKLPELLSSHRKILLPEYFAARARNGLRPLILDY